MTSDYIEREVEEYNQRVYNGLMSPRAKSLLRKQLEKEDEFWVKEAADFIPGYDDGEPLRDY